MFLDVTLFLACALLTLNMGANVWGHFRKSSNKVEIPAVSIEGNKLHIFDKMPGGYYERIYTLPGIEELIETRRIEVE